MKQFSVHVISALKTAEVEAGRLGSDCVDTEHLLLGMLAEADGTAVKILQRLSRDVAAIRNQLQRTPVKTSSAKQGQLLPRSAAVKRAIDNAVEDARAGSAPSTGTEHLLLALMRQPECRVYVVLTEAGVTVEAVRAAVDAENERSEDAAQA